MADRYTTIFGDQIDATALGLGLQKDSDDNLEVYVDDTSIEISTDSGSEGQVRVKDLGITTDKLADDSVTEPKLAMGNSPTDGYVIAWDGDTSELVWLDPSDLIDETAITDDDYIVREVPTGLINNSNTIYTLANEPIAGSEHVYLNGILQADGGNDYSISGDTITFTKAPKTNNKLVVSYIIP
jgi:hypothetical protein